MSKGKIGIILTSIVIILTFSGCPGRNDPITMFFPAHYMDERTEYNAAIFDIDDFMMTFNLPRGWQGVKERDTMAEFDTELALSGVWSVHDIFNEKRERVGAIGFNIYELYPGAENEPIAIYSQIALGNDYRFDVKGDSYSVLNETESGATALADVYYSASINNGTEKYNKGILSYNKDLLVYIAIEFSGNIVTDAQIKSIAESIQISRR